MNTSLTAYTHLESLLLFQSLHVYGLANNAFSRISELLKNNPSITSDRRFQSGRLSPDALRNFCLHLLKEEVRSEQRPDGHADGDGQDGEVRNSRKRKAPSPSYPTVQEAAQDAHLIPKLVQKLYARYRTALTHEIRDDEDKYERLQRELQSIERGERDAELLERLNRRSPVPRSPSLPRKSPLVQQKLKFPSASPQLAVKDNQHPPANVHVVDGFQQPRVEAQKPPPPTNGYVPLEHRTDTSAPAPVQNHAASALRPHPLRSQSPVKHHASPLNQTPQPSPTSRLPQQSSVNAPYSGPSPFPAPYPLQSPYAHQIPQSRPPPQAPPLANAHPLHRAPSPPLLPPPLPSPGAVSQSPHFPPQPVQPYGGNGIQRPGPLPGQPAPFAPPHQQFPPPFPMSPQSPHVHTPQQQRNIPYSGPPMYPPPQPQAPHPSSQGGFMLPPFQVSPQDPSRAQQPAPYPQPSTPLPRQPVNAVKANTPASTTARHSLSPIIPQTYNAPSNVSTPQNARIPFSASSTPGSARTGFKTKFRSFGATPLPPRRPEVESIDDVVPEDSRKQAQAKTKPARKSRAKGKAKEEEPEKEKEDEAQTEPDHHEEREEQVPEMETRQGRSRRAGAARRGRPESLASSRAGGSIRDRSRSQSVTSRADTIAGENDSQAGPRVKTEHGTSFDVISEDPGTPSQPATRRRGGAQTKGRKRTAREASLAESEDQPARSPSPSTSRTVIAPRHFSRMCNPIMNDISSHKHASTFTTAVKPKNAEGYYEIIKRPTDLKSIQKAIAAGAKMVAAAATTDTPAGGSPSGGGGIVQLPLSEDVIPPKAIVNGEQLENELMRMFVNAVMFNPGEDGVVEDAREMFESVQQSVSNWRSAERSSGRLDGVLGMGYGEGTPIRVETPLALAEEKEDGGEKGSKRRKM